MVYNNTMKNTIAHRFFTEEEVLQIKSIFSENIAKRGFENNEDCTYVDMNNVIEQQHLGRFVIKTQYSTDGLSEIPLPESILRKVDEYVEQNNMYDVPMSRVGATFVRYDKKYGVPNLGPHVDLSHCAIIVDYQLESNIDWALGIEDEVYHLSDNSFVAFDALRQYHWRPEQEFEEDSYVNLIFFEYANTDLNAVENKEELKKAEFVRDIYSQYLTVKKNGRLENSRIV